MKDYLGEKPVNPKTHPEFSKYTPTDWAMLFIEMYGQIDGDHHKAWVLDQVARILQGTKVIISEASWGNGHREYRFRVSDKLSPKYLTWRTKMLGEIDQNGDAEYGYEEGIAP